MIDIHTHIIPFIDDGSSSIDASIKIIKELYNKGVTDIICTPHYRTHMFDASIDEITENFYKLKSIVKELSINVNLHLAHEIYYSLFCYYENVLQ